MASLLFDGWARSVHTHSPKLQPVISRGERGHITSRSSQPLSFTPNTSNGVTTKFKLSKLALSGDFLCELDLSNEEVLNAIQALIKDNPKEAIRTLHQLLAEAHIQALSNTWRTLCNVRS